MIAVVIIAVIGLPSGMGWALALLGMTPDNGRNAMTPPEGERARGERDDNPSDRWSDVVASLRAILVSNGLDEQVKWNKPCFGADGSNVAIIQEMSRFCALLFFKGALIDDHFGHLRPQGPNSRSAMRLEFVSADDVRATADAIANYVGQAIEIERSGLKVAPVPEPQWGEELLERLATDDALRTGWESLTPGRQREYHLYFSSAKKSATRTARIDKFVDRMRAGKGMRDR